MKLSHFAQALTLALVAVTAWLAYQAQEESARTTAKLEQLTQRQQATAAAQAEAKAAASLMPGLATPLPMTPSAASSLPPLPKIAPAPAPAAPVAPAAPATADIVPPPLPGPPPAPGSKKPKVAETPSPAPAATPSPAPVAAAKPTTPPPAPTVGAAGSPAPTVAAAPSMPLLTPLQRRIKDSPAIAKVKEAVPDQGFVTLDAGTKAQLKAGLKFDLRRDSAVVGRVTISAVEENEAVADVDPKTIPEGVKVQAGDEVISVVLDR
jgi:hypothetical protein